MISKRQFSRIFNSAESTGAKNRSEDGSEFSVQLNQPLVFPDNAFNCTAEVTSGTCWNSVPNISATLKNNMFYFFYGVNSTLYTVTIPDGIYSAEVLTSQISKDLVNQGITADAIIITGNDSTQRIVLTFTYIGSYVDFTQPDSCYNVLGFTQRLSPVAPTTIVSQSESGDADANFNVIESFLFKTDLVTGSIPTNADREQTIAQISITAKVNEQIQYAPTNPIRVDASNLRRQGRTTATFRLTNEKGVPAETGEDWSFLITFRYSVFQSAIKNR